MEVEDSFSERPCKKGEGPALDRALYLKRYYSVLAPAT